MICDRSFTFVEYKFVIMKTIAILVPEHAVMQAVADPQYCFSAVNQFLIQAGKLPLFDVKLVGAKEMVTLNFGSYQVIVDTLIDDIQKPDLIFIPALFGDLKQAVEVNCKLIPWIVKNYTQGSEVASLCLGAFLLGATGLLDGRKCSTHWGFINQFKVMYPDVDVQDGQIITEDERLYSSGGANSYWNLLLHLVEKYTDRETAILTAKYFAIDIDRNSQTTFAIFNGQKSHQDEAIKVAQQFIESNLQEKLVIEQIADQVAVGRRSFERRFKSATGNTVLEYIQRVKIEAAKRNFESTSMNISEVMYKVGYNDEKSFRSTFKKVTGVTPIAYKKKYQKSLFSV